MTEWKAIDPNNPPHGRVLLTTREPDEFLSRRAALPTYPMDMAFFNGGRWWTGSSQPDSPTTRLWFDPDLYMEVHDVEGRRQ